MNRDDRHRLKLRTLAVLAGVLVVAWFAVIVALIAQTLYGP